MVEASYAAYPTLGCPKGQQQTPESCCSSPKQLPLPHQFELCSTTRQMRENKVLDVNETLTFTVIDSRNTKVSQHNGQIGGGHSYRSQRRVYSGPLKWLAPGPLTDWNASMMWHVRDCNAGSCWSDGEGWEESHTFADLRGHVTFPWSHDCGKVVNSWEISHLCTGN